MQQKLVSQAKAAALCINAATADLIFNNRVTEHAKSELKEELSCEPTEHQMEPQGAGTCFFCKHLWIFDAEGIENFSTERYS